MISVVTYETQVRSHLLVGHGVFLNFSRLSRLGVMTSPPTWWPRNSILLAPSKHFVGRAVILAFLNLPKFLQGLKMILPAVTIYITISSM